MRRRSLVWVVAVAAITVLPGCGGSSADPFDPLPNDSVTVIADDLETVATGQLSTTRVLTWTVAADSTCAVLTVGDASSGCLQLSNLSNGSAWIGGVHGDVSVAAIGTAIDGVVAARFVAADGSEIVESPLELGRASPAVFVRVTPATNEIVGIELLDASGDVLIAAPIAER